MPGVTFFQPHPLLAHLVESIWDSDFPNGTSGFCVMPVVSPILCFHYRAAPLLRFEHSPSDAGGWIDSGRFRVTGMQSRAVSLRSSGPLGGVMVCLRPEAAHLAGVALDELKDAAFELGDVYGPTEISLLEEMLGEADSAATRVSVIERFLLGRLRHLKSDPVISRAAYALRHDPNLSIRALASQLDVSERHLARRFRSMFHTTPKQYARIVRIGKVVASAHRRDTDWAEIAQTCGFSDQAHMIKDFSVMVGRPPAAFCRQISFGGHPSGGSHAESDFYNTFLIDTSYDPSRE